MSPARLDLGPETTMQDAIAKGATYLRVQCHHCEQITDIPWGLLPDRLSALRHPIGDYAGRLRCKRCKHYPPRENISASAQSFAPEFQAGGGSGRRG